MSTFSLPRLRIRRHIQVQGDDAIAVRHNHLISGESHTAQTAADETPLECQIRDLDILEGISIVRVVLEVFD